MSELNPQAIKLNEAIKNSNSVIFDLLSNRGKEIFFPHAGILGQTAEAKGKKLNATIGMACNDNSSIMCLDCLTGLAIGSVEILIAVFFSVLSGGSRCRFIHSIKGGKNENHEEQK